jgi:hypothetical protein
LNENSRRVTIGVWTAIGFALIAIGAIVARG